MIEQSAEFEDLLEYLRHNRGFDFSTYKRTTLMRRVQKRMAAHNIQSYPEYIDYLEVHPDEFPLLFNTILINVTSFFRDADTWTFLSSEIVPKVLAAHSDGSPIRVWVAGCASGEEAYTIAMILADHLGPDDFRERVKIYATDLDDEALEQARTAVYPDRHLENLPSGFLEKFFERQGEKVIFDRNIRRSTVFGKHDLVQDAPISRVDLLLCRNTLMYFNADAQERILTKFNFALSETGFLLLGKAETLLSHTNLFTPVDLQRRIFRKAAKGNGRDRHLLLSTMRSAEIVPDEMMAQLLDASFDLMPLPQIVVDTQGKLCLINSHARSIFQLTHRDIGRPIQDLEISYRPVELRSSIEQVNADRRSVILRDVTWQNHSGDNVTLDVRLSPLFGEEGVLLGVAATFEDVTNFKRLQEELMSFNQELETAYEEVQSTNEELQTTNEELQSTVEELETTNEELHSTNEELETMNEELQSSNEELETINDEVRVRSEQFNQASAFFQAVISSLPASIIVLDSEMGVLAWNRRSEEVWGLRASEALGKHFMNLDIGLPLEQIRPAIRACLNGEAAKGVIAVTTTNRRGKQIPCEVLCTALSRLNEGAKGVILVIDNKDTEAHVT